VLLRGSPVADEVRQVVSELAANAVVHTRSGDRGGWFVVELGRWRRLLWVSVTDQGGSGTPSAPGEGQEMAEHGRGLVLVARLSLWWDWWGDDTGRTFAAPGHDGCALHILGPVRLLGSRAPLQLKQLELVLALALHPSGLSNIQLATLLGSDPDHPKPQDSLRQLITRTRRVLGPSADGREHITYDTKTKLYRLREVALDWARFRTLTARATEDDTGGVADLRAALALIRGRALDGLYLWWIEIPLLESIRADIVDAAEALADLELQADRPQWAAKAARIGLSAEVAAEQLWRCLMRAEHDLGNLAGVHEAWTACLEAISEVSLDGEPHPATTRLFQQLTTGGHTARTANELARSHP
jgi:DNA-binding SARP family transcriptional activator